MALVPESDMRLGHAVDRWHAGHWWAGGMRVIGGWVAPGPGLDRTSMPGGRRCIWVMQWTVHLGHAVDKALAVPGQGSHAMLWTVYWVMHSCS